jgi:tetratricopeptide (TPR) repeat protein
MNTPPQIEEAIELAKSGNYMHAIEKFNEIIKEYPNHWRAYNGRGLCRSDMENFDGAFADFHKAIELSPDNVIVLMNLADHYLGRGRHKDALEKFNLILQLDPSADRFISRGNCFNSIKKHDEALNDFLKAIELESDNFFAYTNVVETYMVMDNIKKAKEYIKKAQVVDPNLPYPEKMLKFIDAPIAKKSDWKTKPMHIKDEPEVGIMISPQKYKMIQKGLIPQKDEDKWFVYFEKDTLFCHRSSDGQCIYEIQFKEEDGEYSSTNLYIEGDEEIYVAKPEVELFFVMILVHIGLGCSAADEYLRDSLIGGLLDSVSFDEMHDRFGAILYE